MSGVTHLFRFGPFSSPGTRTGSARCACTPFALLLPPQLEEPHPHSPPLYGETGLPTRTTLASAVASLGQRTEANNIVPHSGLGQDQAPQHAQAQGLGRPGRGRPKGKPAWNKGKSMSASAKQHLSQSQKARWKKQPALRAAVSAKLQGKEPWNKGQTMNSETCLRMSAARQGRAMPRQVCAKMSRSHVGLKHSDASRGAISQALTGLPKAPEHKAKIAAAQRRRHAAARVLTAVEAFHRGGELSQTGPLRASGAGPSKSGQGRKQKSPVDCLSSRNSQPKSLTKSQIMTAYKAELREYRLLQEELGPWTQAFKAQHGRKPNLADVERTGIEWLLDKFKAYVMMRDRLLSDTSILRDKLHVAAPELSNGQNAANGGAGRPTGLKAASYATKLNANAASAKRSQAQSAATFQAALEYRRQQQALADTAAVSAAAAEAASEAAALEAAATAALVEAAAAAAVAKTAAAGAVGLPDSNVASEADSNGSGHGSQDANRGTAQHAQQRLAITNGSQHPTGLHAHSRPAVAAQNGAQHSTTAQNGDRNSSEQHNSTAQPSQAYPVTDHDNVRSGNDNSGDDTVLRSSQINGTNVPQSRDGGNAKSDSSDVADDSSAAPSTSPSQASASSVADDAMTAAIASIKSQQGDAKPKVPDGGKAIPAPAPGTSPRIKSALLAAQEYRKQKAAKTAALAIAAAAAAKSARVQDSS